MKKSKTIILIPKSAGISPGTFNGVDSHFKIDHNTMQAVLREFFNWSNNGDDGILLENLKTLKI